MRFKVGTMSMYGHVGMASQRDAGRPLGGPAPSGRMWTSNVALVIVERIPKLHDARADLTTLVHLIPTLTDYSNKLAT